MTNPYASPHETSRPPDGELILARRRKERAERDRAAAGGFAVGLVAGAAATVPVVHRSVAGFAGVNLGADYEFRHLPYAVPAEFIAVVLAFAAGFVARLVVALRQRRLGAERQGIPVP